MTPRRRSLTSFDRDVHLKRLSSGRLGNRRLSETNCIMPLKNEGYSVTLPVTTEDVDKASVDRILQLLPPSKITGNYVSNGMYTVYNPGTFTDPISRNRSTKYNLYPS